MQAVPAASAGCGANKKGTPLKINMSPKKGPIGNTSSNHHFSGDMLVFRGVTFKVWVPTTNVFRYVFERPLDKYPSIFRFYRFLVQTKD